MEYKSNSKPEKIEDNKGLLNYENDDKQSLFKLFGVEMTAPKGLKNPRLVYISFIVVNFALLFLLRSFLAN